jgi:hypothetical protein
MRRKPTATVQVNLRIKEEFRRKLEAVAKQEEISLNQLIRDRLDDSIEQTAKQSLAEITSDMERTWERMREATNYYLAADSGSYGVTSQSDTALTTQAFKRASEWEELYKILERMNELVNAKEDPELSGLVHRAQAILKTKSPQQHRQKGGKQ